jgi:hypothetical protein
MILAVTVVQEQPHLLLGLQLLEQVVVEVALIIQLVVQQVQAVVV